MDFSCFISKLIDLDGIFRVLINIVEKQFYFKLIH